MSDVKALLFDVTGVLLTNGWDRRSRRLACKTFDLDFENTSQLRISLGELGVTV